MLGLLAVLAVLAVLALLVLLALVLLALVLVALALLDVEWKGPRPLLCAVGCCWRCWCSLGFWAAGTGCWMGGRQR